MREVGGFDFEDKKTWELQMTTGAFFMEAFEVVGLIVINKDDPNSKPGSRRTPTMLHATDKWLELSDFILPQITTSFSGISFEKPADISGCLLYTSPSPRDRQKSRMPSSA